MRISVRSLAALADDLVPGGEGDEVREALHRDGVAVADVSAATASWRDRNSAINAHSAARHRHAFSPITSRAQRNAALVAGTPA